MLDVCLLGTSGMMPLPRRALTALMTRFNGSSLLIDCGEGTQVSIREKGFSMHAIDTICLTHVHGDHVSGLPGLLLSMGNAERTERLTIIGPKGMKKVVEIKQCEGLLYRFCADSVRYQRASSVTALGKKYYEQGRQMKAAEFAPMYLRLSQAERERMEKENITTRS